MLLRLRIEATGMASRRCETKRRRTRRKRSWKEEVPPTNEHENLTTHFISLGLKKKGLCFQHSIQSDRLCTGYIQDFARDFTVQAVLYVHPKARPCTNHLKVHLSKVVVPY